MPAIRLPKKWTKTRLAAVASTIAPAKPSGFAGTDAWNQLVPADERPDRIRAGIAELCHQDEVEQEVPALHIGEKIDFLDEVQEPRHVHQAEERRRDGDQARGTVARNELPHAQAQHEQDDEA